MVEGLEAGEVGDPGVAGNRPPATCCTLGDLWEKNDSRCGASLDLDDLLLVLGSFEEMILWTRPFPAEEVLLAGRRRPEVRFTDTEAVGLGRMAASLASSISPESIDTNDVLGVLRRLARRSSSLGGSLSISIAARRTALIMVLDVGCNPASSTDFTMFPSWLKLHIEVLPALHGESGSTCTIAEEHCAWLCAFEPPPSFEATSVAGTDKTGGTHSEATAGMGLPLCGLRVLEGELCTNVGERGQTMPSSRLACLALSEGLELSATG